MGENLARKLIADHLVDGDMEPGSEIALRVDQILTHDATGPLCALQLESMGVTEACAQTAVAYVDHLLVESDSKNADDHVLLDSAAQRFGWWFSRAGNGVSHPVHQQRQGCDPGDAAPARGRWGHRADHRIPRAGSSGALSDGSACHR